MEDILGFEGLYQINRQGEVWSCKYKKMMKTKTERGYIHIELCKDKKRFHTRIHRLLALQYIPNPEKKTDVDHIDRNRSNNDLSNLRWATHRENGNNIAEGKGCVFLDKHTSERVGYNYYKAQYSITVDGFRKRFRTSHKDKSLLEKWVETRGQVKIPKEKSQHKI
jgi:hypothetical protein